jgi:DNA-binding CsgD family transcriptional regulator
MNEQMNPDSWLLSIVEDIYDAAFDPALWNQTLTRIVEFAGGHAAGFVSKDASGEVRVQSSVGISPHFLQTYLDGYGRFDPTHEIRLFNVGELHTIEDWLPVEEFRKGQFYQDWARPQRMESISSVLLDKTADGFSYFGMAKSEPVDDELRRKLTAIFPHMLRSTLTNQVLHRNAAVASPIIHILDELKAAVFLLDGNGNITHTNESGQGILARKDFLRSERGQLVAADPRLDRILRDAATASILGDGAAKSESIALPFVAHGGERFVGHFLPLTSGRRRNTGVAYEATAVLFVSKASLDSSAASDIIKNIFKLTPAEARVLLRVVELGGVSETARNLDVAESTVKTHLGRIFTKTDTKRQADLVKLIAAFSPPVSG